MKGATDSPLLSEAERPAALVLNADGQGIVALACEHASRLIPASLGNLGLDGRAQGSHVAWDIGAMSVAQGLMQALDAPLVASRISRLVYDCNRPPEAADAMPDLSERFRIPGNADLTAAQRATRVREVFDPFSALLAKTLDRRPLPMLLVTVHSFTPVYLGKSREVEVGILHDTDARMADAMLASAGRHSALNVARNAPYGPDDGVTYTLRRHALPRGLANVMLEIRNDLLASDEDCQRMAAMLAGWLTEAMQAIDIWKAPSQ